MTLNRVHFTNQTEISSPVFVHKAKSVCCFWVRPHSIPTMVNPLSSPLMCRFYSLVDTHLCQVGEGGSKGVWLRRGDPPWRWMIPSSGLVSLGWKKGDLEDSFGVPAFLSLCFLTWCSWQAAPRSPALTALTAPPLWRSAHSTRSNDPFIPSVALFSAQPQQWEK